MLKRLLKYFISLICIFSISYPVFSQSENYNNYKIIPFEQNFSLLFFMANKFNSVSHKYLSEKNIYEPNKPLSIGIGFVGEKIGLKIGYGFDFLTNNKKQRSESLDLQYHYYGRKFLFDATLQRHKGFYKNSDIESSDIYEDFKTIKSGIFWQYVFNPDNFSYRAAYSQRDMQIKSGGSFLLGGGIYYSEIHCNIPYFFNDNEEEKTKLTNFQLGPSIGVAYNIAITKKFYMFFAISGGINLGFNDKFKDFSVFPTAIPRFSMGYNFNSWSININYTNDLIFAYISKNRKIMMDSGSVQLHVLKRFNVDYKKIKSKLGFSL